ncbi:MAG: serine/threonine-protein kinase, partial [Anaerolineales bacterium]
MTLDAGFLLNNRYRIERVIAHGGMGAIYDAIDESLGVRVAIKENLFSTEESSRQFKREATMLAGLRHPNLPRVTDHFVMPDNRQYLVMDYIEGEDLRQLLERQKKLPEQSVLTIGITICDALSYLHSRHPPIVHRDIKPGNIKITPNGQIFLVDFGLAKYSQAGQATTTGAQALTPGFAPPEQYGQGTVPLSDIYSLGATLYTALTGHVPEDGLARAVGQATLTPVRQHCLD